jgi:hypothetical protein
MHKKGDYGKYNHFICRKWLAKIVGFTHQLFANATIDL